MGQGGRGGLVPYGGGLVQYLAVERVTRRKHMSAAPVSEPGRGARWYTPQRQVVASDLRYTHNTKAAEVAVK
jgi:hypothetical protein